jgi:hypothetical protein
MTTLFIKSLLTSLCQREGWFDKLTMTFVILSLSKDIKEGTGRFSDLCKFNFETRNKLFIKYADISI